MAAGESERKQSLSTRLEVLIIDRSETVVAIRELGTEVGLAGFRVGWRTMQDEKRLEVSEKARKENADDVRSQNAVGKRAVNVSKTS